MTLVYPNTTVAWDFENPFYNGTVGVCVLGSYTGWIDMFYCINPAFWAFIGMVIALGISVIGAGW